MAWQCKNQVVCSKCMQPGHVKRQCPGPEVEKNTSLIEKTIPPLDLIVKNTEEEQPKNHVKQQCPWT